MIRAYRDDDFEIVTRFWYAAQQVAMPHLMARRLFDFDEACTYFRDVIVPKHQIWVYELDGHPVGYCALQEAYIDRLYVDPACHRRGVGTALLVHAKALSPNHLWLHTHQANKMACSFYEKNGFVAEKFGFSPPPESEPDVEYHWRKS